MDNSVLYLQSSQNDLIITYRNPIFMPIPVPLTGFGADTTGVLEIDDIENVETRIGGDGVMSINRIPILITGRLNFQTLSSGAAILREAQKKQKNILGVFPGILNVSSPSGQWNVTYRNFVIKSAFKGFATGENRVSDSVFVWSSNEPDSTIVGDLVAIAAAAIGVI